ncbi:hypothetical protein PHYPSEUDO_001750 [Phytophthora pseudosyringae]|uniref:SET domain-containing protein n=1 Tax=Phytophthora pseudosyringae TaxID=221518 RepID=A0A8T1VY73_9STRA|nr:hypothetical protein PHYPSEUDO_001750 [Phytophthora pseudosyringae]
MRLPEVNERLKSLHARRPNYEEVSEEVRDEVREVEWPEYVKRIEESEVPEGIAFPDIGDGEACQCFAGCCGLKSVCSNSPRPRTSLKLFDTGRVDLGVYTTTFLNVGDVLGDYAGRLCEYDALVQGKPDQALKQNSGYTMLLHTKSVRKKYMYVEALKCGFTTRFISHSCDPNVTFVEMQNRASVKVMAIMIKDVMAGTQLTVSYGDEIWFKCACDDSWTE